MRMKSCVRGFVICLFLISMPLGTLLADGFRNPPAGAAGLGKAGADIAHAEGPSALFYNPANILFSTRPEVEAGLVFARLETDYTSPRADETSDAEWQILPNLYATYPLKDGVAAGLSITFPYGQSVDWDRNGAFKYMAPYFAEMRMVDVGPAMAVRIGERFLLGAGLDIYDSELEIKQAYNWAALVPGAPDGRAHLEGDGMGFGGNVGLTCLLGEKQRLAFRYRTSASIDYDGTARISNLPPPLAPIFESSSHFSTELEFPEQFAAAYGVEIGDRLRVEVDVERLHWSKMKTQNLDLGLRNTALLGEMTSIPYDWKDTWTYGVGGDFAVSENWIARAGYEFIETPVPSRTFSPALPDADRHVLGLGLGFRAGSHSLDLAWDISFIDERRIADNQNPAFNGEYDLDADLCGIAYGYSF